MTTLIPWITLPLGQGFGINTNILETNVLNLAVVIGVVVVLGGDALRSLLATRKATILDSLQEVDRRQKEANDRMEQALLQVKNAKEEAIKICQQAEKIAEQEKKQTMQKSLEDAARMSQVRRGTLELQRQKAIEAISQRVVSVTLKKLQERFEKQLDERSHGSVNNYHTALFTTHQSNKR